VLIDPVKAKGRKDLVDACPYGHIWWNEELQLPQAWTFDAHLIDQGWKQTRGHQSCPTGAMRAICVDDDEMANLAREQGLEVMKPELATSPRVYYKNLWRYSKCFIGGSVSREVKGVVDCVEGVIVRLLKNGAMVTQTATDNYGDFKFDRLDENSGEYTVEISAAGRAKKLLVADMESTMIENEMLDELANFLGLRATIAAITARAMNGEIDFAAALAERVALLKDLPVAKLDEAARRIRYMPGGATLVATMKKNGATCALVSGGFTYFTAMVRKALGFDFDTANVLKHDGRTLAGAVELPILGKEAKHIKERPEWKRHAF